MLLRVQTFLLKELSWRLSLQLKCLEPRNGKTLNSKATTLTLLVQNHMVGMFIHYWVLENNSKKSFCKWAFKKWKLIDTLKVLSGISTLFSNLKVIQQEMLTILSLSKNLQSVILSLPIIWSVLKMFMRKEDMEVKGTKTHGM